MNRAQVDREIVAARAAYRTAKPIKGTPGTNPALRAYPPKPPVGPIRNRRAVKMTATQVNSVGRFSEWARPMTEPRGGWR